MPILYRQVTTRSSGGGGGFFKSLIAAVVMLPVAIVAGAALAIPTRGKSMNIVKGVMDGLNGQPASSSSSTYYEVLIPGPEQVFSEGYAIYCQYKPGGELSNVLSSTENLTYNYIDTTGATLNSKRYISCYPFQGGKAWVKDGEHWVQITKKGTRVGKEQFDDVVRFENGFYKAWDNYSGTRLIFFSYSYDECALYDQNNNRLHKGVFSKIEASEDGYYGYRGDKRIKITDMPKTQ